MLQNASSLAIVAVDTEENEPIKNEVWWVRRHFWEARRGETLPGRASSRPQPRHITLSTRLVLGCIETDFCTQIRILQHFQNLQKYPTELSFFFAKIILQKIKNNYFRKIRFDTAENEPPKIWEIWQEHRCEKIFSQ